MTRTLIELPLHCFGYKSFYERFDFKYLTLLRRSGLTSSFTISLKTNGHFQAFEGYVTEICYGFIYIEKVSLKPSKFQNNSSMHWREIEIKWSICWLYLGWNHDCTPRTLFKMAELLGTISSWRNNWTTLRSEWRFPWWNGAFPAKNLKWQFHPPPTSDSFFRFWHSHWFQYPNTQS